MGTYLRVEWLNRHGASSANMLPRTRSVTSPPTGTYLGHTPSLVGRPIPYWDGITPTRQDVRHRYVPVGGSAARDRRCVGLLMPRRGILVISP